MTISTLVDALTKGSELRIDVLGQVWIEEKAARHIASNLTGTQRIYAVGNRRVVRFRASRRLVAAVNGQFPLVDPKNTSRTCPACGYVDKNNRPSQDKFLCLQCGCAGLADHFAAVNISRRAAVNRPYVSDTQACLPALAGAA